MFQQTLSPHSKVEIQFSVSYFLIKVDTRALFCHLGAWKHKLPLECERRFIVSAECCFVILKCHEGVM